MKRLFLVVVAMLSMSATFANEESVNSVNNVDAYDMSVNIRRLGVCLGLTIDQMESVADVHRVFCAEMKAAGSAENVNRQKMVNDAVSKDAKYMHYILDKNQYNKYMLLINATLTNRGLVKEKKKVKKIRKGKKVRLKSVRREVLRNFPAFFCAGSNNSSQIVVIGIDESPGE